MKRLKLYWLFTFLVILLIACNTNTSIDTSYEGDLEAACTREWPLVQRSSALVRMPKPYSTF